MPKTTKVLKRSKNLPIVDASTGEVNSYSYEIFEEGDFGYHKIWIPLFSNYVLKTGNKQTQVIFYLLKNMNKNNIVIKKQEEIAKDIGATTKTVRECLKELTIIDKNHIPFMVRIGESEYRINPDIIFTGSFKDREYICSKFYAELRKAQKQKDKK